VVVQIVHGRQNRGQGTNPRGGEVVGYGRVQNRVGNANPDKMLLMQTQENGVALDKEQLLFLAGGQANGIDEDVDEQPVQDLALNVDNVFQAYKCDAFDFDVDEAPTTQTMFMVNLSSADPVYDEAGPSYDLDILSEDTLEIAEITRRKMNDKMKDPECVNHMVKIAPHDYSKENFLATFTPQKQLTPEKIFWSQGLIKMKIEALKEHTIASRPIKALTVYPPNKPTTLGIQKALTKEIKEMKDVFEELEAKVTQNAVDRKHDEIERKNLLVVNDNLLAECLSKEVFYVA
nr:hypothetical protein [Tanacetum cinerariifolium]GFA95167.1 hypothetical protein [Tanacetum cinerariifolium]